MISCDIKIFIEEFKKNRIKFNSRIQQIKKSGEQLELTGAGYTTGLTEEQTKIFADAVNALREAGADCHFVEGFTPEQAIDASRKLSDWADEIKQAKVNGEELSPYEKFLYAYEIASQYIYKASDSGDEKEARNVVRILNGDKIVCVGFSNLLKELCDRLDIPCTTVTTSPIKDKINGEIQSGHMLCMVEIEDPKYNLNGVIYSDPTMGCPKDENLRRSFGGSTIEFSKGKNVYALHNQAIDREDMEISKLLVSYGKITSKEDKIVFDTREETRQREAQEQFIKVFRNYCNDSHLSHCLLLDLLNMSDKMKKNGDLYATNSKPEKKIDNFTKHFLKNFQYPNWLNGFLYKRDEGISYFSDFLGLGDEVTKLLKNKNLSPYKIYTETMKKLDELSQMSDDEICKYVFGKSYIKAGDTVNKKVKKANEKFSDLAYGVELENSDKDELLSGVLKQVGLAMGKNEEEAIAYSKARKKYWTPEQEKEYAQCLQEGKSQEELDEIEAKFNEDARRAREERQNHKVEEGNIDNQQDSELKNASLDYLEIDEINNEINSILGIEEEKGPSFEELVGMQPDPNEGKSFEELVGMQPDPNEGKSFEELVGMQPDEEEEKSFDDLVKEKEEEQKDSDKDDEDDLLM